MRWIALTLLLQLVLVVACGGDDGQLSEADRDATIEAMTALELMAFVFDGEPSEEDIEVPLRLTMSCFDLPDTEENRHRAASVLVTMRQDHEVSEMAILTEMVALCGTGANLSFPDAAVLAAVGLAAEP